MSQVTNRLFQHSADMRLAQMRQQVVEVIARARLTAIAQADDLVHRQVVVATFSGLHHVVRLGDGAHAETGSAVLVREARRISARRTNGPLV